MSVFASKVCGDGSLVIGGSFGSREVDEYIDAHVPFAQGERGWARFPLIIADPPYGGIVSERWDVEQYSLFTQEWEDRLEENGSLYLWGGIGKYRDRPFFEYVANVESKSRLRMRNLITWSKRRAYGKVNDYLFTREECAWFTLGDNAPVFNIPLTEKLRGYAGYDPDHPAKSPFLRRTNVWTDVTELFKGKRHPCEKPRRLSEIMIETHTQKGQWILDPFSGSGSACEAARHLGRKFVAIESNKQYFAELVKTLG